MCDRIVLSPYEFISISVPAKAAAALSLAVVLEKRFIHSICCAVKNRSAPRPSFVRVACVRGMCGGAVAVACSPQHNNDHMGGGEPNREWKRMLSSASASPGHADARTQHVCETNDNHIHPIRASVCVCVCWRQRRRQRRNQLYTRTDTPHTHTSIHMRRRVTVPHVHAA